jgi:hypothetical protein
MKMRTPLIVAAAVVGFSATAFAQTAAPKAAAPKAAVKPHKQPPPPMGCNLVGTVKGTKLWAGDCAASSKLRGSTPAEPTAPAAPPAEEPEKQ